MGVVQISASGSDLTLAGVRFQRLNATAGGGMYTRSARLQLVNTLNSAVLLEYSLIQSAIDFRLASQTTAIRSAFTADVNLLRSNRTRTNLVADCVAMTTGGWLLAADSTLNVNHLDIKRVWAGVAGGAISVQQTSGIFTDIMIADSAVLGALASIWSGEGWYTTGLNTRLRLGGFIGLGSGGGAVYGMGSTVTFVNLRIRRSANIQQASAKAAQGGSVHWSAGDLTLQNALISDSIAGVESAQNGAPGVDSELLAAARDQLEARIDAVEQSFDAVSTTCTQRSQGGAIYVGTLGTLATLNLTVRGSTADGCGGAIICARYAPDTCVVGGIRTSLASHTT